MPSLFEAFSLLFSLLYYRTVGQVQYHDGNAKQIAGEKSENASTPDLALSLHESQIASLLKRERYCRDTRQWQQVRNCYHPNASNTRICVGAFKGNIDGFMNLSQMTTPPSLKILHSIDPVEIEIKGSKAVAVSFDCTRNRFEHKGIEYELNFLTRSVTRLERVDGASWKIGHWETVYNSDRLVPVRVGSPMPDMSSVEGRQARASYRCLAWFIGSKGVKMSPDLPGDDKPETCTEVFKRFKVWLDE